MQVLRAAEMGMCFGVRDAIAAAHAVADPARVTVYGELVHNPVVQADLARRGFHLAAESGRALPATPLVLITAHGVSDRARRDLAAAGKGLVDTTCPLVRFAHAQALKAEAQGYFVVVIGLRGHVEVAGLTGDLARHDVVENEGEARCYPDEERIAVVCQTTTAPERGAAIFAAIARANPGKEVVFVDTICGPTRNRQAALRRILAEVEALVVVGGRHSDNTRKLVEQAEAEGVPSLQVEGAGELDRPWLARFQVVGLTAGTSTLDETIDEVQRALEAL